MRLLPHVALVMAAINIVFHAATGTMNPFNIGIAIVVIIGAAAMILTDDNSYG